jgi:hypothetical protein
VLSPRPTVGLRVYKDRLIHYSIHIMIVIPYCHHGRQSAAIRHGYSQHEAERGKA